MKYIISVAIILMFFWAFSTNTTGVKIPDEAIRLRVIPNSNSIHDQQVKAKVKEQLEKTSSKLLNGVTSINVAREIINNNLSTIESDIQKVLLDEEYSLGYKINFGYNYFPKKEFKGVTYEEGYYESLVVTLGSGSGDNWWCVLFPPLCLLEAEESEKDDVEYQFFVKELIDKYF